jgi:hypothetical protein
VVGGTVTVSWVGKLRAAGTNGPALTAPFAVGTKKFTCEPPVKFRPRMTNLLPTSITFGMLVMIGALGTGVTVGDGVGVGCRSGSASEYGSECHPASASAYEWLCGSAPASRYGSASQFRWVSESASESAYELELESASEQESVCWLA